MSNFAAAKTFNEKIIMQNSANILITGATGFIGGFIVDKALEKGMNVWVAVRPTSSRKYLADKRINFIHLDFDDKLQMTGEMQGLRFDYVVHAAGVTKCINPDDFYRVNTLGTKNLVETLLQLNMPLKRFVYVSSLSVFGNIREEYPHKDIMDTDVPKPNTNYGRSKLESEKYLDEMTAKGLPCITLRPTGVYGPREKDYFLMAKSISRHLDFAAGYKPQTITFVYVLDVVQAIFLALENGRIGGKYFLSDGRNYSSSDFSQLICRELGHPWVLRLKAPIWLLRVITFFGEYVGRMTGRISALNNDKYNIMKQRNWRCDISPAEDELGFHPEYDLDSGVRQTIKWYKDNGWL